MRTNSYSFARGRTLVVVWTCAWLLAGLGGSANADQTTIQFDLNTSATGVAAQFDVRPLAAGVGFTIPQLSNAAPHVVDAGLVGSGATRFVIYSTSNSPLSTSGVVSAVMTVSSPSSYADGMIVIENVVASGTNGLSVSSSPNARPLVLATTPAAYRSGPVGSPIPLAVQAIDPDGAISSVNFRINSVSQNVDATRPFSFAWSPPSSGSYTYDAIVTGSGGPAVTSPPVIIRAYNLAEINSFAQFASIHFGPNSNVPGVAGVAADPFGTGIANLLAYSLGLDPWSPDWASLPHLQKDLSGNLIFRFRRSVYATGVGYSILNTPGLNPAVWAALTGLPTTDTDLGNGIHELSITVPSTGTSQFFRLDVGETSP